MNTLEGLLQLTKQRPSLFFIEPFFQKFPDAELFLVGGAVRDWILDRPLGDIDLVARGVPLESLIEWLQKQGTIDVVGKTFGVIKFRPHPKLPLLSKEKAGGEVCIDIALPRTEQPFPDSVGGYRDFETQANPSLAIAKDLARRDFTVNAMAFDLRNGELIDAFLGQHDLQHGILRAVGNANERFQEDLTRILRGIRFAAQLGFTIEPKTWEAMKVAIPHLNRIRTPDPSHSLPPLTPPSGRGENTRGGEREYVVARETIGEELSKAFFADPAVTVRLLLDSGALEELFPSVWRHVQVDAHYFDPIFSIAKRGVGTPPIAETSSITIEHTIILLLRGLTDDEAKTTLTSTGLNTIDKQSPRRIDSDRVLWVVNKLSQSLTSDAIASMRASQFEKQFMSDHGKLHLAILRHVESSRVVDAITKRHNEICARWKCEEHEPIPALLSGEDVKRLGIPEGPRIRELLEVVRDRQLDGELLSREAALKFVKIQME